jgi:hypothetical protein
MPDVKARPREPHLERIDTMRTLFSNTSSTRSVLRRLSAIALIGASVLALPLQAQAGTSGGDGGPAGGAFMSSYGRQDGKGHPTFASSAPADWAHHRAELLRESQPIYRR